MRILLAVDGSMGSRSAVEEVCRRSWPGGSEVRIVTVLPSLTPYFSGISSFPVASACEFLLKQQAQDAAKLQGDLETELKKRAPALKVSRVLLEGRPQEEIVEEAKRWGAGLIVVGSNGYGAVGRILLGSVSLFLAMNAPCSVEIVREPSGSSEEEGG